MSSFSKPIREPRISSSLKRTGRLKRTRMKKPRRSIEDQQWSRDVRARDNHTCRRCKGKGTEAHHIATRARRPDLVLVLSNGATLCAFCHQWCHTHPMQAAALGLLSTESYEAARRV